MKRVRLLIAALVISYSASTHSQYRDYWNGVESPAEIYDIERAGIRYYNNAEYEKAHESLKISAREGLKNSQHYLGIMYLKGLSVSQSLEQGMGWLGVANEVQLKDWTEIYSKIYEKLSDEQKLNVDKKVSELKLIYGLKAQNITCEKKGTLNSRRKKLVCQKNGDRPLWIKH